MVAAIACSDGDGVSQSEYDAVKAELDSTKAALDAEKMESGETMGGEMMGKPPRHGQAARQGHMRQPQRRAGLRFSRRSWQQRWVRHRPLPSACGGSPGDPNAIEIRLITAAERGPTIQSGEVDMLVRTVTWTTSRDASWGNYAQTMFYDGQGFMVPAKLGRHERL